jgi:hypothetical protein
MRWRNLLFAHWEIDPATVGRLIPAGLELDLFDGRAYVGVVPFVMEGVSPRLIPVLKLRFARLFAAISHTYALNQRWRRAPYNQRMPLFMRRWPNGDVSFVSARNREDAIIALDELDNAELAELRQVNDFIVDFRLADGGSVGIARIWRKLPGADMGPRLSSSCQGDGRGTEGCRWRTYLGGKEEHPGGRAYRERALGW